MNRLGLWLAEKLALALDSQERDALQGDHAELGVTGALAVRDVLSLVIRRQLQFWKDWRPWLALFAVIIPLGVLISLASNYVAVSSSVPLFIYVSNWTPVFLESPGSRSDMLRYAVAVGNQYLVLICWSWAVGFLLGSLSRRTIPSNGLLFCLATCFVSLLLGGGYLGAVYPQLLLGVLVLLPSIWGMSQSTRLASAPRFLRNLSLAFAFVTVAVMALRNWGLGLCAWGTLQSCQAWVLQTGYASLFGVLPVQQLPTLPLTLVGPFGYIVARILWRKQFSACSAP